MWFSVAVILDLFELISIHTPCHIAQNPEIKELKRFLTVWSMKEEEFRLKIT